MPAVSFASLLPLGDTAVRHELLGFFGFFELWKVADRNLTDLHPKLRTVKWIALDMTRKLYIEELQGMLRTLTRQALAKTTINKLVVRRNIPISEDPDPGRKTEVPAAIFYAHIMKYNEPFGYCVPFASFNGHMYSNTKSSNLLRCTVCITSLKALKEDRLRNMLHLWQSAHFCTNKWGENCS